MSRLFDMINGWGIVERREGNEFIVIYDSWPQLEQRVSIRKIYKDMDKGYYVRRR